MTSYANHQYTIFDWKQNTKFEKRQTKKLHSPKHQNDVLKDKIDLWIFPDKTMVRSQINLTDIGRFVLKLTHPPKTTLRKFSGC